MNVIYDNIIVKQTIEAFGDEYDFDGLFRLELLFENVFRKADEVSVINASVHETRPGDKYLLLKIASPSWMGEDTCILANDGKLVTFPK